MGSSLDPPYLGAELKEYRERAHLLACGNYGALASPGVPEHEIGMPMSTMQAAVMRGPGGPEVLNIETMPVPVPRAGEVLIKVKAFGLNRSELFTRQGHSRGVQFPRVLGIEAVGVVEQAPGGEFAIGDTVATVMGGMGRQFDGGYAEFTCVPANQVRKFSSNLP